MSKKEGDECQYDISKKKERKSKTTQQTEDRELVWYVLCLYEVTSKKFKPRVNPVTFSCVSGKRWKLLGEISIA